MKYIEFIEHTGNESPVPDHAFVIYRTRTTLTRKKQQAYTHVPYLAGKLNWTDSLVIGLIIEYAIVDDPRLSLPKDIVVEF